MAAAIVLFTFGKEHGMIEISAKELMEYQNRHGHVENTLKKKKYKIPWKAKETFQRKPYYMYSMENQKIESCTQCTFRKC